MSSKNNKSQNKSKNRGKTLDTNDQNSNIRDNGNTHKE
ncbi:hypothetical protein C2W64_00070 [Brevibacillus laterosporus]|nr:hypothetical protein C2W64_00070 [Brevibacillus laterosporus]